ncbi:MAG: hypothetical protein KGI27_13100 [Thaumarchaeota archaeon]|nr:hypothetical protein [Nitrososphaerota archaeon]
MNQKLRYVGLLAILPVFATTMISSFANASALEQGNGQIDIQQRFMIHTSYVETTSVLL